MGAKFVKYGSFFLLLGALAVWFILLYFYGAEKIVEFIGIQNSYLLLFAVASLGGVSSFTSASFYTTLFTLAAGGLNPFYLGLIGGTGVTIGDSIFFFLGLKGREVVSGKLKKLAIRLSEWIKERSIRKVQIFSFIYAGFFPLPNDILTASLGISGISYKKIIWPILSANIISVILLSYIAS